MCVRVCPSSSHRVATTCWQLCPAWPRSAVEPRCPWHSCPCPGPPRPWCPTGQHGSAAAGHLEPKRLQCIPELGVVGVSSKGCRSHMQCAKAKQPHKADSNNAAHLCHELLFATVSVKGFTTLAHTCALGFGLDHSLHVRNKVLRHDPQDQPCIVQAVFKHCLWLLATRGCNGLLPTCLDNLHPGDKPNWFAHQHVRETQTPKTLEPIASTLLPEHIQSAKAAKVPVEGCWGMGCAWVQHVHSALVLYTTR